MKTDFVSVTELSGDLVTKEQVARLQNRYCWACQYCVNRNVLEVACGTGPGLGMISKTASFICGSDISEPLLGYTKAYYKKRIPLTRFDALCMPFLDNSFDVIIVFEALYYLSDVIKFIHECRRILKPEGYVLLSMTNSSMNNFHPSPFAKKYFTVNELSTLLIEKKFMPQFYGFLTEKDIHWRARVLSPIKKMVVRLGLMPKTMQGKKVLKRFVYGKLVPMPYEIGIVPFTYEPAEPIPVDPDDVTHKVIYCAAKVHP